MKSRFFISNLLIIIGIVLGIGTTFVALIAAITPDYTMKTPNAVLERVQMMMDAICVGDDEAASANIYGTPGFGSIPEQADPLVYLAWDAYRKSFSYTVQGQTMVANAGVSVEVNVRSLNVSTVLADLRSTRTYRQDKADEILQKALNDALEDQAYFTEQLVALDLAYDDGQWWILPNKALTSMLTGLFLNEPVC